MTRRNLKSSRSALVVLALAVCACLAWWFSVGNDARLGTIVLGSDPWLVEGRVADEDGRGLAEAIVSVEPGGLRLLTDAQGHFGRRGLPRTAELALLPVKADYYTRGPKSVSVPSTGVTLALESGGELRARVTGPPELLRDGGLVALFATDTRQDRVWVWETPLDAEGRVRFPPLPYGPGRLFFGLNGTPLLDLPVEIARQPTELLDLDLGAAVMRFQIEVRRADGSRMRERDVELSFSDERAPLGTALSGLADDDIARFWIPRRATRWEATCDKRSMSGTFADPQPVRWIQTR